MIYVSLLLFGVGAIVAAVANNFTVILVGRSVQGIGGGGVIALTEIVVTDLVPLRERGKWFSMISSMWALGTVIGPLMVRVDILVPLQERLTMNRVAVSLKTSPGDGSSGSTYHSSESACSWSSCSCASTMTHPHS